MKTVMIIDRELPAGIIANTAAVLGISLGKNFDYIVGHDTHDADGNLHLGITMKTIPILGGTRDQIKTVRDRLFNDKFSEISVIAQKSLDYDTYAKEMANSCSSQIFYWGICLYGPVKRINKLTGSMGLLR